jgi:hypothetical protein
LEAWAAEKAGALSDKTKPTAPLSQKLNLLATEARSLASRFRHACHVTPLLDELRAASVARSHLVHSSMKTVMTADRTAYWMFKNNAHAESDLSAFDILWDEQSFEARVAALRGLQKKLDKQGLK